MNKIKKCVFMIFIVAFMISLCACKYQSSSEANPNESISTSSISTDLDMDSKFYGDFTDMMLKHELLPKTIVDDMKDFRRENNDSDTVLYMWSSWNDEKGDFNHNIQLTVKNNAILSYKYKNYYFNIPNHEPPLTENAASYMVTTFSQKFIPEYKDLIFENNPNMQVQSLYDPSHVETWTAKSEHHNYYIVVDFDLGGIIYYEKE